LLDGRQGEMEISASLSPEEGQAVPLIADLSDDPEIIKAERNFTDVVRRVLAKRAVKPAKPSANALERRLELFLREFLHRQAPRIADQVVRLVERHRAAKALEAEALAKKKGDGKIVLMRHAEKLETSPHLSAAGHLHAERLALTIPDKYGMPDVVYAPQPDELSHRSVETATPLVDKYGIKFKHQIPHADVERLVNAVRKRAEKGKFVLVVWRHDELPEIARELGMKDVPAKWPDDDFSTQWELGPDEFGKLAKGDRQPISHREFQGFPISVENKAGTWREWDGGRTLLLFDYGYIRGSIGSDGDQIDVYIGPNDNATHVYVVRQIDTDTAAPDEDKCFVGFDSEQAARVAFLAHRDDGDRAYGGMHAYTVEEFREKVHATLDRPGSSG
jgi:phosphohistidine phosphatase SixA